MAFQIKDNILLRYIPDEGQKKAVIPRGVEEIADKAFSDCYGLESVFIPNGVKRIGRKAFYHCWNMQKINIPETVTEIGEEAFYHCESLKEMQLPEKLEIIGKYAFAGCRMKEMTIPPLIEEISAGLCSECKELEHITIPETVKRIGDNAFEHCRHLKKFTFFDKLETIGASAFEASGLEGILKLPKHLLTIGETAFCECRGLTKVIIPESVTLIEKGAFALYKNLKIMIPDTEIKMKQNCFDAGQKLFFHRNGKCFIVVLRESWSWTALEKDLSFFLQHPTFGTFEQIRVNEYKQAVAIGFYDKIPRIREYLTSHIAEAIQILIDEQQIETIEILLHDGIITKEAIDPIIDYAIASAQKGGSFEIQTLLMNYKAEHIGFESIEDRLKL
ncbi:MAG: leucine-rich repeat domain-containing protein [Oscillospiraceae bacterium]